MIKQNNDAGKTLFNMLSFQYKPLETKLLKECPEEVAKQYHKLNYMQKIHVLDGMAAQFNL